MDVATYLPALSSAMSVRAWPSFGGISSPSANGWTPADGTRAKTVLDRYSYFYALGWTLQASGSLQLGAIRLEGEAKQACYDSIQGLDRAQESVTDDARATECLRDYGAAARLAPQSLPVTLGLTLYTRTRTSRVQSALPGTSEAVSFQRGRQALVEAQVQF